MLKIVISGYYGYGNLGDEAILSGLLAALKRVYGSLSHVTVLSANPEATRQLHQVAAKHRYRQLISTLRDGDIIISGGGGLLQDKTSQRSLLYYLGVISFARLLGKKVLLVGQSIGPLSSWGKKLLRLCLKGLPIAVRDEMSQKLLAELGLNSYKFPDLAFLMPIVTSKKDKQDYILLIPRGGYDHIQKRFEQLLEQLEAREYRLAALAMQHEEDMPAIAALCRQARIEVLTAETPFDAYSHIASARYVISARLHGLILAAKAGVDFQGLVYDPKVAAFLAENGGREVGEEIDLGIKVEKEGLEPLPQSQVFTMWLAEHLTPHP